MTANKIGFFGGSFNPVHKGHVAIAEEFIKKCALDILYVIPNNVSPLKTENEASGGDRFNMLEIAFSKVEKAVVTDMELRRAGKSYTRDTVAYLKELHPQSKLFMLVGDDWIDGFDKWKDPEFILSNVHLAVAYRQGKDISSSLEKLKQNWGITPLLLGNKVFDCASTNFRTENKRDILPEGVYEYIEKRGLYGI